jgi:maltooligosyltrehalose trehalohydrolase
MEPVGGGYFCAVLEGVEAGSRYLYRLDREKERPDPASRFQPYGVHGPSMVVDPAFSWSDRGWAGLRLADYIIYELHVGTFTPQGTFDAILPHLGRLADLGITALELMPVAQFPGSRNWGYDGVFPFAVQNSYGGPEGLRRLVERCHESGLAVVLDVVYNHLGPEGNCLQDFGPYFTSLYRTPWGSAVNFDGSHSDEVRRFFLENALYWITEFHIDALRLDAVHAILDFSAQPFLRELAQAVHAQGGDLSRRVHLFPESDLNDARLVISEDLGGYGLDAQWNDDFHHALHALLTGEQEGYYEDFGRMEHLVTAFQEGFVYRGQVSAYRKRRHGSSSRQIPAHRFIVFSQNHDQVGNRMLGERLSALLPFEASKLAAAAVLLAPFIPLLFMGEEYAELAPFQYFVSHQDPHMVEAVRKGRREEFAASRWKGESPDPQDEATFLKAKLNHDLRSEAHHRAMQEFYKELLTLRRTTPSLAHLSKERMEVRGHERERVLALRRWGAADESLALLHFAGAKNSVLAHIPAGNWEKRLDSADERWLGPGSQVPPRLDSHGETRLTLSAYGLVLFWRPLEA